ncbi:MAG: M17 family peptidase N-terminal domain-containing protein [Bosea sp. (in: a-proteobacteria)]|nr:M17 family peptidase N-terminal domain-containing protein [Bosea sp. (in: a-proteobacteria)]
MEIVPAAGEAEKLGTEFLVLGVFCDGPLMGSARAVNNRSAGRLAAILDQAGLGEAVGATCLIGKLPGVAAHRLLLVGLGRAGRFSDGAYRQALAAVAVALKDDPVAEAVVTLAENEVPRRALSWRMRQAARILADGRFDFGLPDRNTRDEKCTITLLVPQALTSELVEALRQGVAIGEGVSFAKELGDLSPDLCAPAFVARTLQAMSNQFGFTLDVLGRHEFEKHGMTHFLARENAVAGACKLFVVRSDYRKGAGRPIVLIGDDVAALQAPAKHEPFAPPSACDMHGIGSVLGAMRTVERLGLVLNVVGLIVASQRGASCLDRDDGHRARNPSLLGDMLGYAAHFSPSCVITVAALSRASFIALGSHASGLFANDEGLASELLKCGGISGDGVWQLPLWEDDPPLPAGQGAEADQEIECPADAIAAASNLARFATAYPWAHLDISGTASTARRRRSTGRPVPLLAEFLIGRARAVPGHAIFSPRSSRSSIHE